MMCLNAPQYKCKSQGTDKLLITALYMSPGSDVNAFSEHVEQLFLELSLHISILLCGDFNIDILKHNSNRGIKYFLDTMYAIGLYPLIDRPTRISNQSFSLIDKIFTNVTNYNITSGIFSKGMQKELCPGTHHRPGRAVQ